MKKLMIAITIAATILSTNTQAGNRDAYKTIDDTMRIYVNDRNKNLPENIDSMTVLTSASFSRGVLTGRHTIDINKFSEGSSLPEKWADDTGYLQRLKTILSRRAHNSICYDIELLQSMIDYEISFERQYYQASNERFMTEFIVDAESCSEFMQENK